MVHRIDTPTAAAVIPSPQPVGTPGFFTEGNPLIPVPPTVVSADWLNAQQEELLALIEGMGLVPDKGNRTQVFEAVLKAAAAGSLGNVLINPAFTVWNRKGGGPIVLGATSRGYYGPDRWLFDTGGGASTLQRVTLTGATDLSYSGQSRVLRWTAAAVVGQSATMRQRIERVETLQALPVVLTFDVQKAGGADFNILSVELEQVFGVSAPVTTALAQAAGTLVDGSWRRQVWIGVLPTTVGKTADAAGGFVELRIKCPVNTAVDFRITAAGLARGSKDPGFFPRLDQLERLACFRYYENSARDNANPANVNGAFTSATWDTGLFFATGGGNAIGTLKQRFRVDKGPSTGFAVVWYGLNALPGFVTERLAVDVHHAVASSAVGLEGYDNNSTGAPILAVPPAPAVLRSFVAAWACFAEIYRAGDDAGAP